MLTTMKEESYRGYLAALTGIYILAVAAYIFLTITLIKKRRIHPLHKKIGRRMVLCLAMFGIGAAKILSTKVEYTAMIRIAALCSYFISLVCILGVFHLVKYFAVKKLEIEEGNKKLDNY